MGSLGVFFKSMLMEAMEEANNANKRQIQEAVDNYWYA
jgi:hypothetical protein